MLVLLLAVNLRCSSGCGLRTRPARGTGKFVIMLLVQVTWRSCGVTRCDVVWLIKEEGPYLDKSWCRRAAAKGGKRARKVLELLDEQENL